MNAPGLVAAAWDEVRAHRVRAVLAGFSILVGVATLTLIVALSDVAQQATRELVEREAGRPATYQVVTDGNIGDYIDEILPRIQSRLDRYGVADRSREFEWIATIGLGQTLRRSSVIGVDARLADVRALRIVDGRWLVPDDDARFAPVAVPNKAWIAEFGASLGAATAILIDYDSGRTTARIIGVVDDGKRESRLYVPATVMVRLTGTSAVDGASYLLHVVPTEAGHLVARLQADLQANGGPAVSILRVDEADDFASIFTVLQGVLSAIAAVSLLTGALGILNLGLVTTGQRAREFAIRRSFGATRLDIFVLVLSESVWTTLLGGALGVAAAAGVLAIAGRVVESNVDGVRLGGFPTGAAMLGLAVATVIGGLAGAIPARSATRLTIIDTIRG